ncbi:MAG TPA: SdrD B-like domain-containing protein [Bacillota bacterium]
MGRVILLILLLIVTHGIVLPNSMLFALSPELETSVVTLLLQSDETVIEKDPLFEILDLQSHILIPVNKLPPRFDLEIDFQREQNQLVVAVKNQLRQVTVDFNKGLYRIEDQKRMWPEETPLIFNHDFFVSPLLLEYLTGVQVEWNFKYQELSIKGNWKIPASEGTTFGNSGPTANLEELIYQEGPSCSLGTIRYELLWEYQKDAFGQTYSEGKLQLRGDGRAGKWAISLGGEVDYQTPEGQNAELSLIRAKYNDENKLVVFGDSDLYLENTLRQQELRGVLVMSPSNAFSRFLIPYTSVTGEAQPGDQVVLYLNGKAYDETLIPPGQERYSFNDVPLAIKRLNILKVVITKPSGESRIIEKTVAASLRILDQNTNQWLAAGGYFRKTDSETWEKQLAAFKVKKALTEKVSFASELTLTRYQPDEIGPEEVFYGADTGIAFRLGQNIICSLDWLVGGAADDPASGWQSSALYCLEKGFIEGIIFYIDPTIPQDDRVQVDPGRGFKLLGELEITDRTAYQVKATVTEPLREMLESFDSHHFELRRNYKYGADLQNLYSIGLRDIRTENYQTKSTEDQSGLFVDQNVYGKNFNFRNYLSFDRTTTTGLGASTTSNEINYETDYIKMFNELSMFNLSVQAKHNYGTIDANRLYCESGLRWLTREHLAGIYAKATFYGVSYQPAVSSLQKTPFQIDNGTLGLWGKYFFTPERSIYASWDWNIYERDAAYTYGLLNFTQLLPDNKGKLYAEYSYASPFKYKSRTRNYPEAQSKIDRPAQHSYKLGIQYATKKGWEIKLELERWYENLTFAHAQQVYRLTCGQAIGFSGKHYKTITPDYENLSFVSGTIYLDENGNGQYDRNEKTLPGLRMSLNGRQVTTNENGEYLYKNVEPDAYRLFFDLRSLPADYTPVTDAKLFKLKENENMFFDFGVTLNGSISGKVFLDQNANRAYDPGDQPLNWVAVVLDHGKKKVYTGSDGVYYFENVPLGEHSIEVLADSLQQGMVISGNKSFVCAIREDALDITDLNVPVVYEFKGN